ncbi:MAG TPA: hypothetical protein VF491_17715 [Vicinamibacterales bacterium]
MSDRSVRQMVSAIQVEMRSGDVLPARAREMLMTLTSLLGNCNTELTRAEGAYTAVLAKCLDEEKKANRAKIRAELSPEFTAKQEARNTLTLVVELIRSLKVILRSVEEEMRLSR